MPYWNFEQIVINFIPKFEMEQSYERTLEIMKENVATRPGDQDLLLESVQAVAPGYTITAQDEAERAERREISEIARNNLFAFFHKFGGARALPKGQEMERGIDLVFDLSDNPEAAERDQQARRLFTMNVEHVPGANGGKMIYTYPNSTIGERTEFVKARLDQLFQTDFSKLYTMTDRDVAENFPKMYPLYMMVMEGGDNLKKLNGTLFNLPQSYLDKMMELKWQHQGVIGAMKARFDCIMNPNYEIFHYERMKPAEGRDFSDVSSSGVEGLEERVLASDDATTFVTTLGRYQQFIQTAYVDRINHEIEKLNLPKEMLLPPEANGNGARIASPLLKIFLPGNGVELSAEDLKKGFDMVCFTNPATGQTHFLKSDGVNYKTVDMSRLPAPLRSEPDKLMKALEEADPWYIRIFTGSKQFDEMKKAMKAVQELKDQMGLNPTAEQRKELAERLSTLTEKSTAYLYAKDGGVIWDNSSDAERARITTAQAVLQSAMEGRALLGGYEQALAFRAKVHDAAEAANEKGMEKQSAKENDFLRPRDLTQPIYSKPLTKEDIAREVRTLNNQMMKTYMNNLKDGDPLKSLGRTIFTDIDKNLYVAKSETGVYHTETPKFSLLSAPDGVLANAVSWKTIRDLSGLPNMPPEPETAQKDLKDMLAKLVSFDLIVRERAQQAKGEVGPLEKQFREIGPTKFSAEIGKSKTLQNLSANMNSKEFRALVGRAAGEGGIQKLTAQVLEEYQKPQAQKGPQEPQVQQVLQQNVPEPPKPVVPGGN